MGAGTARRNAEFGRNGGTAVAEKVVGNDLANDFVAPEPVAVEKVAPKKGADVQSVKVDFETGMVYIAIPMTRGEDGRFIRYDWTNPKTKRTYKGKIVTQTPPITGTKIMATSNDGASVPVKVEVDIRIPDGITL